MPPKRKQMDRMMNSAADIWEEASRRLNFRNAGLFQQWFCRICAVSVEEDRLTLGVPDEFFGSIVSEQYDDLIVEALQGIGGRDYSYGFTVCELPVVPEPEPAPVRSPEPEKVLSSSDAQTSKRPHWNAPAGSEFCFDNFVVSETNRHAFATAKAVAEEPGYCYNPLFIYGNSGVGKTHLLKAISRQISQERPGLVIRSTTCDELVTGFYDLLLQKQSLASFRSRLRDVDVLLVDDIHGLANKRQLQDEFFNIFNALYNQNKQIVFTSDRQPCEIQDIDKRLTTRFESGMVVEVCMPEYEARLVMLRRWRDELLTDTRLKDELLDFLASHIASSVRRLKGAFLRLASYLSMSGNSELTIADAEALLQKQLNDELASREISLEAIQREVAAQFGITTVELLGKQRPRRIAEPRMVAMYLSRELTRFSSNEIGEAFGRTHSAVLYAEQQVPDLCRSSASLNRTVSIIRQKLSSQKH